MTTAILARSELPSFSVDPFASRRSTDVAADLRPRSEHPSASSSGAPKPSGGGGPGGSVWREWCASSEASCWATGDIWGTLSGSLRTASASASAAMAMHPSSAVLALLWMYPLSMAQRSSHDTARSLVALAAFPPLQVRQWRIRAWDTWAKGSSTSGLRLCPLTAVVESMDRRCAVKALAQTETMGSSSAAGTEFRWKVMACATLSPHDPSVPRTGARAPAVTRLDS